MSHNHPLQWTGPGVRGARAMRPVKSSGRPRRLNGLRYPAMAIYEPHLSPDGTLELLVDLSDDGDWAVGFDGFAWHTHSDILEWSGYVGTPAERVQGIVDDIISSRRVFFVSSIDGKVRVAWVADDPSLDGLKYAKASETIKKRRWDGQPAAG